MTAESPHKTSVQSARSKAAFGPCVNAGVDYITLSCNSVSGYDSLAGIAARLLHEEIERGNKLSYWRLHNYDGRTAGSVQAASDGPTIMLRLSGRVAWEHWKMVLPLATNVSRLDLQSTVKLESGMKNFAERCETHALRFEAKHKHGRQVELRRNSVTGKTLYIGSPKSDRLIRIYDKGKESKLKEYENCWRAEAQFNNALALSLARQLESWISQETFAQKAVSESLKRVGLVWPGLLAKEILLSGPARPKPSCEKRLAWLSSQVRPAIASIRDYYPLEVILAALGLDPNSDEGEVT